MTTYYFPEGWTVGKCVDWLRARNLWFLPDGQIFHIWTDYPILNHWQWCYDVNL